MSIPAWHGWVCRRPSSRGSPTSPSGSPAVYYYGGSYYQQAPNGYTVVAPVAGTVVEHLPEGGEEVTVGDQKFVKFGETYYQPIQQNGKNVYEVVEVKAAA